MVHANRLCVHSGTALTRLLHAHHATPRSSRRHTPRIKNPRLIDARPHTHAVPVDAHPRIKNPRLIDARPHTHAVPVDAHPRIKNPRLIDARPHPRIVKSTSTCKPRPCSTRTPPQCSPIHGLHSNTHAARYARLTRPWRAHPRRARPHTPRTQGPTPAQALPVIASACKNRRAETTAPG